MSKEKRIGVIMDSLDGIYQKQVSDRLMQIASVHGLNLLFFTASAAGYSHSDESDNRTIFDLPNRGIVDGLLVAGATMASDVHDNLIESLNVSHRNLPSVGISLPCLGTSCVGMDNGKAMDEILTHVEQHASLADSVYVSGPFKSFEALVRLKSYETFLENKGIRVDSNRIYEGSFMKESGMAAVDHYLPKGLPEVFVCANDEMAQGVIIRLAEFGYSVPGDVKVTGFDNIATSNTFFTPLTTYHQPITEICQRAVEELLALIEGKEPSGKICVEGQLVVRESCGDTSDVTDNSKPIKQNQDLKSYEEALEVYKAGLKGYSNEQLIKEVKTIPTLSTVFSIYDIEDIRKLIEKICEDVTNKVDGDSFLYNLNALIEIFVVNNRAAVELSEIIRPMRSFFMRNVRHQDLRDRINRILDKGEKVIVQGTIKEKHFTRERLREMYLNSRQFVQDLNSAVDMEDIKVCLNKSLKAHYISHCYMVLFRRPIRRKEDEAHFVYPALSQMVYAYEDGYLNQHTSFTTRNILPAGTLYGLESMPMVVMALFSDEYNYGYIVFSLDATDNLVYESLRSQLGEALNRQHMARQRSEAEKALEAVLQELENSNAKLRYQSVMDELTGLYNRRGFYQNAEKYFRSAVEDHEPFFMMFADIDGLKVINDSFGHNEGDFAIRKIAKVLASVMGDKAVLARISGDEFTALVKNTDDKTTVKNIIKMVKADLDGFNAESDKDYDLSVSMGYARYNEDEVMTIDDLLRNADANLYRQKDRKKAYKSQ